MDLDKSEIRTEPLPESYKSNYINVLLNQIEQDESLTKEELFEKIELLLIQREVESSDAKSKNFKFYNENRFILGQFYFEAHRYEKACEIFDSIKLDYYPALYQLAVILYDDLLDQDVTLSSRVKPKEIDTKEGFRHPNREKWKLGFEYMSEIAHIKVDEKNAKLVRQAQFNVGKAYFQGFGVRQSDEMTEKYWLMAADDGSLSGSVSAMTHLAFFYSRKTDPEYFDLDKAFFWHNEACGYGSLESQGALGAMYYFGIGRKKDIKAAYDCLNDSSERGNVYAMGILCDYYYRNKFYVKANELSRKVSALTNVEKIAQETNCLKHFIAKGIAIACFTQARLLDLGKVVKQDTLLAQKFYKRSFYFDPDLCQLFQNHTTHELI